MTKLLRRTMTLLIAMVMVFPLTAQVLLNEDFETLTSGVPVGWDKSEGTASEYQNWNYYKNWSTGNKQLRFDTYNAYTDRWGTIKTPAVSLPVKAMQLTFDYINEGTAPFHVYISTDGGETYLHNPLAENIATQPQWGTMTIDLSAYANQANVKIVFKAVSPWARNSYIYIDNVRIAPNPTCKQPINLYISGLTDTGVTLNWDLDDKGDNPSAYNLLIKDDNGVTVINQTAFTTTGNYHSVTGLNENTRYTVLQQSDCQATQKDLSEWSEEIYFTTLCTDPIILPQTYSFAEETGDIPNCWMPGGANIDEVELSTAEGASGEGDKSVRLKTSKTTDAYIATPKINHPANDIEIRFKAWGTKGTKFHLGLISDVSDGSSGIPFPAETLYEHQEWCEFVVNTSSSIITDSNYSLMFYIPTGVARTIYIDDITIRELPSCIMPSELMISGITPTSATFAWNTPESQTNANYQIFLQSGINEHLINATSNPYTYTGLNPDSKYDVMVRQICSEGDTSDWSLPKDFTTFCSPTTDFPIETSFEDEIFPPECWRQKQSVLGIGYGTDYNDSAWVASSDKAHTGTMSAKHQSTKKDTHTLLALPYATIPAAGSHEVCLWVYRDDRNSEEKEGVNIWVNTTMDTIGATKLGYIPHGMSFEPTVKDEGWFKYTYTIPMAGDLFVMIEGVAMYNTHTYIDDVVLRERPDCLPALKIKQDSIDATKAHFSWDIEAGSATQWIVEYKTADMENYAQELVVEPNFTIEGLTPNSPYHYYLRVKSYCSAVNQSEEITDHFEFRTECLPVSFPFYEDFEEDFNATRVHCWGYPLTITHYENYENTTYPATKVLSTTEMATYKKNVLVSPEIAVEDWTGKRIYVSARGEKGTSVRIGIMENQFDTTTFVALQNISLTETKTVYTIDITQNYAGKYVGFLTPNVGKSFFDNIKVVTTPTCEDVESFATDSVTATGVTVNITDAENTAWDIIYGTLPFDESTASIARTTTKEHRLENLSASSTYKIMVRSVCAGEDLGVWSESQEFTTPCLPFAVELGAPFFEGFENGQTDGETLEGCWKQENIKGNGAWIINSSLDNFGRLPYEGYFNAYLEYSNEDYIVGDIKLKSNTNYRFTCYARQDMDEDAILKVCVSAENKIGFNGTPIVDNYNITSGDYQMVEAYFTVTTDAIYELKVGADVGGNPYYLSIDNIKIEEILCAPASMKTFNMNTLTSDSVSFNWGGNAAQYLVKLSTNSIEPNTENANICTDTVNTVQFNKGGLSSNTTYYYYIKSICGDNKESEWTEERTFTTSCSSYALPMYEGFNSNRDLACWQIIGEGTQPTISSIEKIEGTHAMVMTNVTFASPELNTSTLSDKQISAYVYSEIDTLLLTVGIMSDVNNTETYVPIEDLAIVSKNQWHEVVVDFSILSTDKDYAEYANSKYIVLVVSEDHTATIDDLRITDIPTCKKVRDVSIANISDESATISWTANTETSWAIRLIRDNKETVLDSIVTTQPVILSNLAYDTDYKVEVRAICSSTDTAATSLGIFRTNCPLEMTAPFSQNFNHLNNGDIVSCWVNDTHSQVETANKWSAYKGEKTETTSYMYDSYTPSPGKWSLLETPIIDLTKESAAVLSFEAMNADGGNLQVLLSTDGGESFPTTLLSEFKDQKEMVYHEYDLTAYCGNKVVVGFKGISNCGYDDAYIRIDNVSIDPSTTCIRPDSVNILKVTADTIQAVIYSETETSKWETILLPAHMDIADATVFTEVSTDTFYITTHSPATRYRVYARTVCEGEESKWTATDVFHSHCEALELPITQGFEDIYKLEDIPCIEILGEIEGEDKPKATITEETDFIYSGSKSLKLTSSETQYIYYVAPEIVADIDTVMLSLYYKNESMHEYNGNLEIGLMPISLDKNEFISLDVCPVSNVMTYYEYEYVTSGYSGTDYRVALRYKAQSDNYDISIDDITIAYRDACAPIMKIQSKDIAARTATLKIIDKRGSKWEIAYGTQDSQFSTYSKVVSSDREVTIDSLIPASIYNIYARSICGEDTSKWSAKPFVFATECVPVGLPYTLDFEGYTNPKDIFCTELIGTASEGTYPNAELMSWEKYVVSGRQALVFNCGKEASIFYRLPKFALAIDSIALSFYYANGFSGEEHNPYLRIGLIPVGGGKDDFIVLKRLPVNDVKSLINIDFAPYGYKGRGYQIAFECVANGTASYNVGIDDIHVDTTTTCFLVEDIEFVEITNTSAKVVLNDHINNKWELSYGPNGTAFENLTVLTDIVADTVELSGLTSSTRYQVYARGVCSESTSEWSEVYKFNTDCGKILINATTPYTEDFQEYENLDIPICWNLVQAYESYPSVTDMFGTKTLDLKDGANAIAIPEFTLPYSKLYMNFDATYSGMGTEGKLYVSYSTKACEVEDLIDIYEINIANATSNHFVDFTVLPDSIAFVVLRTNNFDDISIDNVNISLAPNCYTPNGISTASLYHDGADIQYLTSPSTINVEYAIYKNGAQVSTSWTTKKLINVRGLESNTEYGVVLRSACNDEGVADTTLWSDTIYFTTIQSPGNIPYVSGFENVEENNMWTTIGTGSNQWIISTEDASAINAGIAALYVSKNNKDNEFDLASTSKSWAYRTFNLEVGIYKLSYLYKSTGSYKDYMRAYIAPISIGLNSEDVDTENMIAADSGKVIFNATAWTEMKQDIVITEAGYYNLAFYWENNFDGGEQSPAAVDNINMTKYECSPLLNTNVVKVGSNSATIALNDYSSSSMSYEVVLKTSVDPLTQTDIDGAMNFNRDTVVLEELSPETNYYAYARIICSIGDTTAWSERIAFRTLCLPDTIDAERFVFEGFEDYAHGQEIAACWQSLSESGDNSWTANTRHTTYNRAPRSGNANATLKHGNADRIIKSVYLEAGIEYSVSLWARQNIENISDKNLFIGFVGDNSIDTIVRKAITHGDYQKVASKFTPSTDGEYSMFIKGDMETEETSYMSIDDIRLYLEMCAEPTNITFTNITSTSADISWTSDADSTNIRFTANQIVVDTTVINSKSTNNITIEDLPSMVTFKVEISNVCNDYMSLPYEAFVYTPCGLAELPYTEDFESYNKGDLPTCWNNMDGTVAAEYRWAVDEESDVVDNMVMKFDSDNSVENSTNILTTRTVKIEETGYYLSLDYKNPAGGAMSIYLSTDGGNTYEDSIVSNVTQIPHWTNVNVSLSDYVNKEVTVVIRSISNAGFNSSYHYIDNIRIACDGGERTITDTVCAMTSYKKNGFDIPIGETATAGLKQFQIMKLSTSADACDTVIKLNLIVNPAYNTIINHKLCKGAVYSDDNFNNITEEGQYIKRFTSSTGCDSIITLNISELNLDTTILATICEGDSYSFHDSAYVKSGRYTYTIVTSEGCSGIETLELTVLPKQYITEINICEGDSYDFEGTIYTASGVYSKTFKNHLGCDSIMVLDLTVHGTTFTLDTTICQGQTVFFNGEYRSMTGQYSQTYESFFGCDSTATLNLTVTPADTLEVVDFVCEGDKYYGYGAAGIVATKDTIIYTSGKNEFGCDSVLEINLSFIATQEVYDTVNIENGETYSFGGNDLTGSGDYDHRFTTSLGCDSIVYLRLNVGTVGTGSIELEALVIAPNPVDAFGQTIINRDWTAEEQNGMRIEVINAVGKHMYSTKVTEFPISLSSLGVSGIYYVRITAGTGKVFIGKLIVK